MQLAVGEDVAVDERGPVPLGVARRSGPTRDRVVEQPPPRRQEGVQVGGVLAQLGQADVLGHPDAGDGVVRPVGHVAVVLDADLDPVSEPRRRDGSAGEGGLLLGEGDPDGRDPVLASGVDDEGPPAAPDVEQAHPRGQAQLARHEVELGALRVLQGVAGRGRLLEVGAGVHHRRTQDERVEVVSDVVVVGDRLARPVPARAAGRRAGSPRRAAAAAAPARRGARRPWRQRPGCRARRARPVPARGRRPRRGGSARRAGHPRSGRPRTRRRERSPARWVPRPGGAGRAAT